MAQEPQNKKTADADPPAPPVNTAEEPEQVIRPEDEAVVAERLRELGYIE
jgi:hypothetical protein